MKSSSLYVIKLVIAAVIITMSISSKGFAQNASPSKPEKAVTVQKYDLRSENATASVVAALSASRSGVVVVLVQGGDQKLIEELEGTMKALLSNGYERIGLIMGKSFPEEKNPVVSVYSKASVYAVIKDGKSHAEIKLDLFQLVRDAYQEDVAPLLKK